MLGLYGGKDTGIPVAHVEMMRRDLEAPSETADDGWARMLAFFKKQGV